MENFKRNKYVCKSLEKGTEKQSGGTALWESITVDLVLYLSIRFFPPILLKNKSPRLTFDQEEKRPYTFRIILRHIIKTLTSIAL